MGAFKAIAIDLLNCKDWSYLALEYFQAHPEVNVIESTGHDYHLFFWR